MSEREIKPLHWTPDPEIGFSVQRRSDGGMHVTFTNTSQATLSSWRNFALKHLFNADRLTRNLYDLRLIDEVPEEAISLAVEANSDPSARKIRVAVVVANDRVQEAVRKIVDMTPIGSAEILTFTDLEAAERWLSRPLSLMA